MTSVIALREVSKRYSTRRQSVALCKEAGVAITPAGATFPFGKDPKDANIRISPTRPPVAELEKAIEILAVCIKLASAE